MKPISRIEGVAAPLPVDNISTDIISPSALLGSVNSDLAKGLFGPWRYREDGSDRPDFVLNQPRFAGAGILLAGRNFGCGSSREHAVWCLARFGIRAVIAPSFGEIFAENAFKNGLVTVTLPEDDMRRLCQQAQDASFAPAVTIDIETCRITAPDGGAVPFALEEFKRTALLEGLDELDIIRRESAAVARYQERVRAEQPWRLAPLTIPPAAETGGL